MSPSRDLLESLIDKLSVKSSLKLFVRPLFHWQTIKIRVTLENLAELIFRKFLPIKKKKKKKWQKGLFNFLDIATLTLKSFFAFQILKFLTKDDIC